MTLLELRTLIRQRANMENSQFVTDAELTNYVNASYAELYDLLVSRFEDYFIQDPYQFTLTNSVSKAALPSDFYKLRGVDLQLNSPTDWVSVSQYNFAERNTRKLNQARYGNFVSYRVLGSNIQVMPAESAAGTYQLWYIPRIVKLENDSDSLTGVMDFEEYIVVDAAIKCLIKEESETSVLLAVKEQLRQRILTMSSSRDAGTPERVGDVYGLSSMDELFPR